MLDGPFAEIAVGGEIGIADQGENTHGLTFSDHADQVEFQRGKIGYFFMRILRDDDGDAVEFRQPLQPRGEVYRIAQRGIGEALFRAHITDRALAGRDPYSRLQEHGGSLLRLRFLFYLEVHGIERLLHPQRGQAGVAFVTVYFLRRVPEGHHGVADIFINRAALREDDIGHGGQEFVHQVDELFRVQPFGDFGEFSDIREHDGEIARFAAEFEFSGVAFEFPEHVRSHVHAEGLPDLAALRLGAGVREDGGDNKNGEHGQAGIDRVKQKAVFDIHNVGAEKSHGDKSQAQGGGYENPDEGRNEDEE